MKLSSIFTSPFSRVQHNACSANSLTIFIRIRKFMPSFAKFLSAVYCCQAIASHYIFPLRNRFKVVRVDATSNPAEMVQNKTFRNFTFYHFVNHSMRALTSSVNLYKFVATRSWFTWPNPTFITNHIACLYKFNIGVKW